MSVSRRINPPLFLVFLVVITVVLGGCDTSKSSGLPGNQDTLRLFVFDCGRILVKDIAAFSAGSGLSGPKELVNTCYLIAHPQGLMFWDAGLNDAEYRQPMQKSGMRLEVVKPLRAQLKEIGLNPGDVDHIAFSHLHFDHVGNAALFTRAQWLIQKKEFHDAFTEAGRRQGFQQGLYAMLGDNPRRLLRGDYDVFGDGKVSILSAPGHTSGHQMLIINLARSGPVLLSGDLYHFAENRRLQAFPRFNYSAAETRASMDRIEALVEETGARLIIQHDPEHIAELPKAPEWLE